MSTQCECRTTCQCAYVPGPAAYQVTRDGKDLKVCTRCTLSRDTNRKLLVTQDDDANEFMEYDSLGFLQIVLELSKEEDGKSPLPTEHT